MKELKQGTIVLLFILLVFFMGWLLGEIVLKLKPSTFNNIDYVRGIERSCKEDRIILEFNLDNHSYVCSGAMKDGVPMEIPSAPGTLDFQMSRKCRVERLHIINDAVDWWYKCNMVEFYSDKEDIKSLLFDHDLISEGSND